MPEKDDGWGLLHDLVFGIPQPMLVVFELLAVLLVIVTLVGLVVRTWKGDQLEIGPLKIERPELVQYLETSFEALGRDDRLKANVLWVFRERLNEANRIITAGIEEAAVRHWCRGVLTDVIMTLGEGGHDRHRASLWTHTGNQLQMYNAVGFRQDALDYARLPLTSIAGDVMRTGTPRNSKDVDTDNAFCPKPRSGQPYRSLLTVPVKTPFGAIVAALCIDAEAAGYFDGDHEFFAACFADLLALLLTHVVPELVNERQEHC